MKKYISIMLCSILIYLNILVPVKAITVNDHDFNNNGLNKIWDLMQDVGYIVSYPAWSTGKSIGTLVKNYLNSKGNNDGDAITSDTDGANWLNNGISVNGDNNVLSQEFNNFLKYTINDYTNSNKMYVGYSLDLRYYDNGYRSSFIQNEVVPNQDDFLYFICSDASDSYVLKVSKSEYSFVVNQGSSSPIYSAYLYNNLTFQPLYKNGVVYKILSDGSYSQVSNEYIAQNYSTTFFLMRENYSYRVSDYNPYNNIGNSAPSLRNSTIISYGKVYSFYIYSNLALFQNNQRGENPYYIDNSVYNDFSSSTGDYTLTTNNTNHTSYGDIIDYNNSFNTENGTYPSPEDVERFINNNNNTIINNGTNDPNTNSGNIVNNNNPIFNNNPNININLGFPTISGNSSVSGNGSGSSGGIFDWISSIGGVIGDFIKNVGELIADVVKGITETITTILADIPNLLNTIVDFVYAGLPDELKALVTLGITAVVLVSVIKVMRK